MNDFNRTPQKRPKRKIGPSFSIIKAVKAGYQFAFLYKKITLSLAILPLIVTMLTEEFLTSNLHGAPFYVIIAYLPAEFTLGLCSCIIVRLMFAHMCNKAVETHKIIETRPQINEMGGASSAKPLLSKPFSLSDKIYKPSDILIWLKPLLPAIVGFTFVNYLLQGFYFLFQTIFYLHVSPPSSMISPVFMVSDSYFLQNIPEETAPIILIALLALIMWFMRYMWIPVIIALKKPLRQSFKKIGGMEGSLAIGFLFFVIYVSVLLIFALIMSIIFPFIASGTDNQPSAVAVFISDTIGTLALILAQFIFMAASTNAVFEIDENGINRNTAAN